MHMCVYVPKTISTRIDRHMGIFFFLILISMAFVRGKDILVYKMKKKKRENTLAIHSAKG